MIIYTQYSLSNVPCYKDFLHRHLKNRRDVWEGGKNMERKTRLLPYILVTALCLAIALGASAGYGVLERLNRRYYSLVVYLAALRVALPALFGVALYFWQRVGRALAPGQRRWVNGAALLAACLCAWLGFSLMWIEFTGYVGLWLFMALLLCALLGDLGAG